MLKGTQFFIVKTNIYKYRSNEYCFSYSTSGWT